ncbi:hypothetical protein SAMN05216354_0061 [Xylanibacter ruminicola]|uniref:Uncharacterized protein n=1 Tax=Xylanibacter ruminicola TaxID=839 RepID=A0A1H5XNV6_XYLRU|nr:hypothetical protein SAMN05216354_0061 [Xylanibacter ruminicola]
MKRDGKMLNYLSLRQTLYKLSMIIKLNGSGIREVLIPLEL